MAESLTPKQMSALNRVLRNPDLQPLLFKKAKGLRWFDPFYGAGFFKPENNPKPLSAKEEGSVSIPFWPITEYLVSSSAELVDRKNEDYAAKFLDLIRSVTSHAENEKFNNYRTWWQFAKIMNNIPPALIKFEDLDLTDYWLDDPYHHGVIAKELGTKWLPRLLSYADEHSLQIALRLLSKLYRINFVEKSLTSQKRKEVVFRYDPWYAKEITKAVGVLCGRKLGLRGTGFFENLLISMLDELGNDSWTSILRPAIEDHEQNSPRDDAANQLLEAYRDCLLGFIEDNPISAKTYLKELLSKGYQTLYRVVIYAMNQKFDVLNDLIDNILAPDFFRSNLRHELWHLLSRRYAQFTPDQKQQTVDIIERMEVIDENMHIEGGRTAYERAIWLSAIKHYDSKMSELYEKYIAVIGVEPEHPDFSSYWYVGSPDGKSPIPIEDLLILGIDELVGVINSYKDPGRFRGPGLEGLIKAFKQVIKGRAHDVYKNVAKFIDTDLAFIYPLLEVYHELWNEKSEQLPWEDVWLHLLNFCVKLVEEDRFWAEESAERKSHFVANRQWVASAIARIVHDGTRSDDHAFHQNLLTKAKALLLSLLGRQEGAEFNVDSDAVFVAINSPRGQCIEAMINLTLHNCRLADKQSRNHIGVWNQFQSIYDSELRRADKGQYEFATLVANFLPNFLYMSAEWVNSNFKGIFDKSNYQKWLCAVQGYSYVSTVYREVYQRLKVSGDFQTALDDQNLKEQVKERIVQNIVLSYLNWDENIDDSNSLISVLLGRNKYNELSHLIWYIWSLRGEASLSVQSKVYELWPRLIEFTDFSSKDGMEVASSLCHWAAFIDKINDTTEKWLLAIAPYGEKGYHSAELLDNLSRLSQRHPLEVQRIWLRMLSAYSYDHPEEAIRCIFKHLVLVGPEGQRKAKEVVDTYLRHGMDRPRTWLAEITHEIVNDKR